MIDWGDIEEHAELDPVEAERLESLSGEACPACGKEMSNGENEAFGACCGCYGKSE